MAFNFGMVSMFDDPNSYHDPVIEALAKAIPSVRFKGAVYQAMGAPAVPITQKEYEMYSRTKSTRNGTIGAAWDNAATSGLAIPATYINGLTVGHVIEIGTERVVIKAVDRAANTISVFGRGYAGTTPAAHAANSLFTVEGFASRDTDLPLVESITESTIKRNNYVATVIEKIEWEKSTELSRKGLENDRIIYTLRQEAIIRVSELLSRMAIHGKKQAGTYTNPFQSSGIISCLKDKGKDSAWPTQIFDNEGLITEAKLTAALNQIHAVGEPDTMIMNLRTQDYFKTFHGYMKDVNISTGRDDHVVGRYITGYNYNGRLLNFLVDVDWPDNKIAVVTMSKLKKGWLENDTLKHQPVETNNPRVNKEVIHGSVGFDVEGIGYDHLLIENITYPS